MFRRASESQMAQIQNLFAIAVSGVFTVNCAGSGGDFSESESVVVGTCADCHDLNGFESFLSSVRALDPSVFSQTTFTDDMFPSSLRTQTTAQLIAAMNPARDSEIPPNAPDRMAWVLHLLHELDLQLNDSTPSAFANQASFDEYNASGGVRPNGCETIDRLDGAESGSPSQMPPLWTEPLLAALGTPFTPLSGDERSALRTYVESTLPQGITSCF